MIVSTHRWIFPLASAHSSALKKQRAVVTGRFRVSARPASRSWRAVGPEDRRHRRCYPYLVERVRRIQVDVSARVTSKGQITIPRSVRDALGLADGDQV